MAKSSKKATNKRDIKSKKKTLVKKLETDSDSHSEGEEYVVEGILGAMLCSPLDDDEAYDLQSHSFCSKWIFYVKWEGYHKKDSTWQLFDTFCPQQDGQGSSTHFVTDFFAGIKSSGRNWRSTLVGQKIWLDENEKDPASDLADTAAQDISIGHRQKRARADSGLLAQKKAKNFGRAGPGVDSPGRLDRA